MPSDDRSSALEALITRYAALVRHVGRSHGLADADVDEVFQEVRIRLWRARGSSENIASVGTSYLYRTSVSAALDVIRRRRSGHAAKHGSVEANEDPALMHATTPEDDVQAMETREAIEDAVQALVPSRRPVVRMYLTGYSREEIARLLGWSEAKTRNLLYRGLAELRDHLSSRGIHPEGVR